MKQIKLTWTDGKVETVQCLYWKIENSVLYVEVQRHQWRMIPLPNIREWVSD